MSRLIREEPFDDAQSFIDALRITNKYWGWVWSHGEPFSDSHWYFRGHSSGDWKLQPGAWRPENEFFCRYRDEKIQSIYDEIIASAISNFANQHNQFTDFIDKHQNRLKEIILQILSEWMLVGQFALLADRIGFPIEDNRYNPEQFIEDQVRRVIYGNNEIATTQRWWDNSTAIAQHHGVPTRLLDWTRNSFYAAYFAAFDIRPQDIENDPSKRLAVYAITASNPDSFRDIEIELLPHNKDQYVHAQSGLFTYMLKGESWYLNKGVWPSIDEYLEEGADQQTVFVDWGNIQGKPIRKFTLPIIEVPELLSLLWAEGVSRMHLMPTLDNVWNTMKFNEEWRFANKK